MCPSKQMKEPPNALALAINLQPLALKDAAQWVQNATPEEIEQHKGIRSTFYIVDMLFPGFTYVSIPEGGEGKGGVKGNNNHKGGKSTSSAASDTKARERLAIFDEGAGERRKSVIFYTYKGEQNKKLGYLKTKRFDECAAVSPGMVVSTTIWANKFHSILKKEADDVGLFDLCLVNLGIKSIASNASSSGLMLEIKGFTPMRTGNLAYCSLVPHDLMPPSIQESVLHREKFVSGGFISDENRQHLNQVFGS